MTRLVLVLVLLWTGLSLGFGLALGAQEQTGIASTYGRRDAGTKTANGERVSLGALSAAHLSARLGSYVGVVGPRGRWVIVRINDRGPYVRGRIIDMTPRGMVAIGCPSYGLCRVTVVRQ